MVVQFGERMLASSCAQLAAWATNPLMIDLTIAVNVISHQFRHRDFGADVLEALQHPGTNPALLKLKLTVSLLAEDSDAVNAKMRELKVLGIGFSLDDFGTRYSSLSYLHRMPLDQLKIDQSFVCGVLSSPNDAAIASTIVL